MKRRSFTGPFWLQLLFGIGYMTVVVAYLRVLTAQTYGRQVLSGVILWRFFLWPIVILVEALVYWLIRRRNQFRALSWAHTVIFTLSFLLNIFFTLIWTMHYRVGDVESRMNSQIARHELGYLFWALVIVSHLAFVAVLANCLRKMEDVSATEGGGENLLDDVVL
jgi:hypothetical protein